MSYSMNSLYEVVGISKQAVHQNQARRARFEQQLEQLIREMQALTERMEALQRSIQESPGDE